MLKKTLIGVLFVALLSTLLITGVNFNVTKAVDYGSSGTQVGGIIWENTTWTLENSPYIITETVQIPEGVMLTIEPGVTVTSTGVRDMFLLHGKIQAHGTVENKIIFNGGGNSIFFNVKQSKGNAFLDLDYCVIKDGVVFWHPTGYGGYGYFSLRHSEIIHVGGISYVYYPENNIYIEYNKFINSGYFSVGISNNVKVYIRYNIFLGGAHIDNWASYKEAKMIVKYNSFINLKGVVLELPSCYDSAAMSATENYWGTQDTDIIDSMIYDKKDDITCAGFIEYLPILAKPHPDTPTLPINQKINMGWNLIGLPLIPEDPSIEAVLSDILPFVESVWTFDGETKTWSSYSPGAPSDLTEMVLGRGYWIKMTEDATLTIHGRSTDEEGIEVEFFPGWNLIGLPTIPDDPSIEVVLSDILPFVESVWTYDGGTKEWSSYSPGAPSDLTEMCCGKGYWLKMNEDVTWTFEYS